MDTQLRQDFQRAEVGERTIIKSARGKSVRREGFGLGDIKNSRVCLFSRSLSLEDDPLVVAKLMKHIPQPRSPTCSGW